MINKLIESLEFLKSLGETMNTQEHDSQADPRFWVVAEDKREYGVADDYLDGTIVYGPDCEVYDTVEELVNGLINDGRLSNGDLDGGRGMTFDEMLGVLDDSRYYTCNYRNELDVITPDTMFLTKEEAINHIQCNRHHYKDPHTYAMTAWRSPQVAELYEILKGTDWDELIAILSNNQQESRNWRQSNE